MYAKMGEVTPEELEQMLEDVGTIQDTLTNQDFYMIDAKIEETARGLGLTDIGLDKDVNDLKRWTADEGIACEAAARKAGHSAPR